MRPESGCITNLLCGAGRAGYSGCDMGSIAERSDGRCERKKSFRRGRGVRRRDEEMGTDGMGWEGRGGKGGVEE